MDSSAAMLHSSPCSSSMQLKLAVWQTLSFELTRFLYCCISSRDRNLCSASQTAVACIDKAALCKALDLHSQ